MKTMTTTTSVPRADSSLDATLNPVELRSKEIVSWGIAFPRPGSEARSAHIDVAPRLDELEPLSMAGKV